MQICASCGKRVADGLTTCKRCGGQAMEFDVGEDAATKLVRQPWFQGAFAVLILLLGFGLVRQVMAHRSPSSEPLVADAGTATPSPSSDSSASVLVSPPVVPGSGSDSGSQPVEPDFSGGLIPPLPFVGPDPGSLGPSSLPTSGPTVEPLDPTDAAMPQEVRDWLTFLASIEQERQSMASAQLAAAAGIAGSANNSQDGGTSDYANAGIVMRAAWADLSQRFNAEPAPQQCAGIRGLYNTTLTGTRTLMIDLLGAMRNAQQSPERAMVALTRIRDESLDRVDAPAESVDEAIDDLCANYNVDKWFDIDNRIGERLVSQLGL